MSPERLVDMKVAWIDVETTGVDPVKHGIIQLALIIEVDYEEKERHSFFIKPDPRLEIEAEALGINGITEEQMETFPPEKETYHVLKGIFCSHVNPYDRADKFLFGGYNCRFDMDFLYNFWKRQGDSYFFSLFSSTLDVKEMIACNVWYRRIAPPANYKLGTVAKYFGFPLENAHNAMADIEATRELAYFLKPTKLQEEKI